MINFKKIETTLKQFRGNQPFDHCVVDGFFDLKTAKLLEKDFPNYDDPVWYEFARTIISKTKNEFNLERLYAIETHEFPVRTKRPENSILSNNLVKNVFQLDFSDWIDNLSKVINM